MQYLKVLQILMLALILDACTSTQPIECPPGTQDKPDCPPAFAVEDEKINGIYDIRTWVPPSKLTNDPIKLGKEAEIPVNSALAKIICPSLEMRRKVMEGDSSKAGPASKQRSIYKTLRALGLEYLM